jgi:hypothetical protein
MHLCEFLSAGMQGRKIFQKQQAIYRQKISGFSDGVRTNMWENQARNTFSKIFDTFYCFAL